MEEQARQLLEKLMEYMQFRGPLPEEGKAVEDIMNAFERVQRSADVMDHLDELIEHWRDKCDRAAIAHDFVTAGVASCYVDAYQSVRKNLFGEVKG